MGLFSAITSRFGYDALDPRGRRKSVPRSVYREDYHTRGSKHRGLQASAADITRNLSLASWMVRRHLDYVAQFEFHGRNESEDLNNQIEALMLEDSRPARTDVAGRFGREKFFRLAECRRVLDGDTFLLKLRDGRLQGIQADLVQDPDKRKQKEDWVNGVLVNGVGRPMSYAIHKRSGYTGSSFARRVNAPNIIHYGFFDRYAADQVRGISPLTSALAPLRDIYENFSYALAKAKVSQLFAMAVFREGEDSLGHYADDTEQIRADMDGDHIEEATGKKMKPGNAANVFNFKVGEDVQVLESKQPSVEFQQFTELVMQVALKALDIPFSFYDESKTNFFGSRAAWLHYERSCKDKRDDQIELRRNYTIWKVQTWIGTGRLVLPRGMTVADLRWEWVPRGMPWWDPSKEIRGHVEAIKGGLDTPQRICRSTGTDFYDNVDAISQALQYAEQKGVPLQYAVTKTPDIQADDDDEGDQVG